MNIMPHLKGLQAISIKTFIKVGIVSTLSNIDRSNQEHGNKQL